MIDVKGVSQHWDVMKLITASLFDGKGFTAVEFAGKDIGLTIFIIFLTFLVESTKMSLLSNG